MFLVNIQKIKNSKKSYILQKALVLPIICCKCGSKDEKVTKKEESIEILKIIYKSTKNMEEFRLKEID